MPARKTSECTQTAITGASNRRRRQTSCAVASQELSTASGRSHLATSGNERQRLRGQGVRGSHFELPRWHQRRGRYSRPVAGSKIWPRSKAAARFDDYELQFVRLVQRRRTRSTDRFFMASTARTTRLTCLALVSKAAYKRFGSARPAVSGFASAFAAHAGGAFVRNRIARPRPTRRDNRISPGLRNPPTSPSFPSTHAASAFAAASALGRRSSPRMRLALLLGAATTSTSRVWLGVHYLSDVIAGAALGLLAGRVISTWLDTPDEDSPSAG
jgi:membrane-associated phospholipid phosphatase